MGELTPEEQTIADEQADAAAVYEAAIAAMEPYLAQAEDGAFSFEGMDLSSLDADPGIVRQLMGSADDLNSALADEAIAASEIETGDRYG